MKTLLILNDQPYGSERPYNALRLAISLAKRLGEEVRVFLMGDAAACAKSGQKVPDGYYNLERMLQSSAARAARSASAARAWTPGAWKKRSSPRPLTARRSTS